MMFNTDKTVFFSVPYCEAETSFNDFRLSTSKVCKDLGLYLTPELSWDEHLKRKLGHLNSLLIRLKRELPVSVGSQVKMVLFKSYFLSSLLYNSQIWYPSQKMLDKLELFQKRAIQWILDIKDYHQRLRALKLFPISYQLQMADQGLQYQYQYHNTNTWRVNTNTNTNTSKICQYQYQYQYHFSQYQY